MSYTKLYKLLYNLTLSTNSKAIVRIELSINNTIKFYNIAFRYFLFNIFKSPLATKSQLY